MRGDTIALVAGKAILRKAGVEFEHDAVAGDLGDDAGGGDAEAEGVTADNGGVGHGQTGDGQTVHQGVAGRPAERVQGTGHRQVCGAEDVEAVDFVRPGGGDRPADIRVGGEGGVQAFAAARCEFLGVVESGQGDVVGKDDGGGDDGSGEGPASGFINAGDKKNPAGVQGTLAGEIAGHRMAGGDQAAVARAFSLTVVADLPLRLRR